MDIKKLVIVPMAALVLSSGAGVLQAEEMHDQMPTVETEAVELRGTLDHLLSEHAFLAAEAMRKGADGAADFENITAALDQNTTELSAAIESVYGEEAGMQFKEM